MSYEEKELAEAQAYFEATMRELNLSPAHMLRSIAKHMRRQVTGGYRKELLQAFGEPTPDVYAGVPGMVRELEVLAVAHGSPERRGAKGHYFTERSRLFEEHYPTVPVFYNHAADEAQPSPIGVARFLRRDERGAWYAVALDFEGEPVAAEGVWKAAREHMARASTGTATFRRIAADGHVDCWPVIELSLMDARFGDFPDCWDTAVLPKPYLKAPERLKADDETATTEQPSEENHG